jgi:hypothetical protein
MYVMFTSQLRGRHQLCPGGQAMVICQVSASVELGLVSTANSPGSRLSDFLFFPSLHQRGRGRPSSPGWWVTFFLLNLLPQLTAAARNYTYAHLQIWANDVAVAPGRCCRNRQAEISPLSPAFTLTFFLRHLWGHSNHWARLVNYISSLRSDPRWTFLHCFPMPPACPMSLAYLISY